MKKVLAIALCLALMLPALALAEGDGRVHITYSFWGNQTEADSVQQALDAYNAMQGPTCALSTSHGKKSYHAAEYGLSPQDWQQES